MNPHPVLRGWILSPVRLPVPPLSQGFSVHGPSGDLLCLTTFAPILMSFTSRLRSDQCFICLLFSIFSPSNSSFNNAYTVCITHSKYVHGDTPKTKKAHHLILAIRPCFYSHHLWESPFLRQTKTGQNRLKVNHSRRLFFPNKLNQLETNLKTYNHLVCDWQSRGHGFDHLGPINIKKRETLPSSFFPHKMIVSP